MSDQWFDRIAGMALLEMIELNLRDIARAAERRANAAELSALCAAAEYLDDKVGTPGRASLNESLAVALRKVQESGEGEAKSLE